MDRYAIRRFVGQDLRGAWRFTRDLPHRGTWAQETAAQALKAGAAALLAWFLAAHLLALPQPYLAPWAALVVVRPTVQWSMLTGLRQVVAVGLGVAVAVLSVALAPGKEIALAVSIPVAFLVSYWPRLDDQALYVPFTALFMIAVDYVDEPLILARLAETALGAAIGMAVNLLLAPPSRTRTAGTRVRRDGTATANLLRAIATALRDGQDRTGDGSWASRAKRLEERVAETRSSIDHAREALRLNPQTTPALGATLDRYQQAHELNRRIGHSARALADFLDGPARSAMPDCILGTGFGRDCATALQDTADALERRVAHLLSDTENAEPEPVDDAVLEALQRRAHADGTDQTSTEMQATVIVAMRRLLHDLS